MAVTGHGPASSTVTRATLPSSWKTWVMPSFLARIAGIRVRSGGETDLDVDARREVVQALERVDRLGVGWWMSIRRLCVRISKCSRESLSLKGERITQ